MKRTITILLLLVILFTPALAQEDTEFNERVLAPSEWMIGTWVDATENIGFEISKHDIRMLFSSYGGFQEMADASDMQAIVDVDSVATGYYAFYYLVPAAGIIQHYEFIQKSPTTLEYTLKHGEETMVEPVILNKKFTLK